MRTWIINHIPAKEQAHYSDDIKTAYVNAPDIEGAWDVFLSVYRKRLILSCYEQEPKRFTPKGSRL
jgi:hypothetical protein